VKFALVKIRKGGPLFLIANKLMHPSTGLEREYLVRIRGAASQETITMLTRDGVDIDGKPAKFERILASDMAEEGTNHWYKVVIKEGRYREVRRMWDAVGHTVSRLKRIRYGSIKLTREVKRGKHTKIAPKQLEKLVASVGIQDEFATQLYSSRGAGAKPKVHRSQRGSQSSGRPSTTRGRRANSKPSVKPVRKKNANKGRSRQSESTKFSNSESSSNNGAPTRSRKH